MSIHSILLIDDEANLLLGLKAVLERAGYKVLTSTSGQAGIDLAKQEHPDLIVCDVMMPVMDGFKVQSLLQQESETANIPFLFLSARINTNDKVKGLESGADDYVTKPFDSRELVARIDTVLRRHEKLDGPKKQEVEAEIARIREEVVRNVSHELRTPMTQILMALEIILREKFETPEDLTWFAETALSQSHRLNRIIEDMIFLSNYDLGFVNTLRQLVNLDSHFLAPIQARQNFYSEKQQKLDIHISPGVVIHAPQREFTQAAIQLVDNALKFAPPMTRIDIELKANRVGGCILTVTNYGECIPEHLLEKVFERNFQISQGDTRKFNGLGVGLTIARLFARSMGGDVTIQRCETGCQAQMILPPGPLNLP